jgi:hypothetical protein
MEYSTRYRWKSMVRFGGRIEIDDGDGDDRGGGG